MTYDPKRAAQHLILKLRSAKEAAQCLTENLDEHRELQDIAREIRNDLDDQIVDAEHIHQTL